MSAVASSAWVSALAEEHLDAAYNLGRWLLGNEQDAADAVHDAFVRATRSAHTYAGGNARAWWLAIVRNCCLAALKTRKREVPGVAVETIVDAGIDAAANEVESKAQSEERSRAIERQLRALPVEFREALILREIEDLSYREIADVLEVPIGTVMSRLSRGRALLQKALAPRTPEGDLHGL
ncbi:MAG TPA: sigma-70 family RNA polymerase sigma factor [Rhodanobacteraceae bacterium]|nr:sigma-70 family RNA polymerase sigma factor [Rhodanobacteraceae bacterium]